MIFDPIISYLASAIKRKTIPNIWEPKTLTDKILKIKMSPNHYKAHLRSLVTDRVGVRSYVSEKSPNCKLVPMLWSGCELTLEVYNRLPNRFVIKANHGSKMVRIVNKRSDSFESVLAEVEKWKYIDYYRKGREWVYKDIPRIFVVESFMDFKGDVPPDYKFFCLNGEVAFVQVDLDRYNGHSRNIYDKYFNKLPVKYQFDEGYDIDKPKLYEEAITMAKELSVDFDFIRVDLYILEDGIYFGELTNFPGNCMESFEPKSFDYLMGKNLLLDI